MKNSKWFLCTLSKVVGMLSSPLRMRWSETSLIESEELCLLYERKTFFAVTGANLWRHKAMVEYEAEPEMPWADYLSTSSPSALLWICCNTATPHPPSVTVTRLGKSSLHVNKGDSFAWLGIKAWCPLHPEQNF